MTMLIFKEQHKENESLCKHGKGKFLKQKIYLNSFTIQIYWIILFLHMDIKINTKIHVVLRIKILLSPKIVDWTVGYSLFIFYPISHKFTCPLNSLGKYLWNLDEDFFNTKSDSSAFDLAQPGWRGNQKSSTFKYPKWWGITHGT